MTQFSSRPPFNDDPEPYLYPDGCREDEPGHVEADDPDHYTATIVPRPEFDRPQHNPTNPILVFAREHPDSDILWSYLPFRPTDEQITHARKVLRRRRDLRILAEAEALFTKES